MKKNLFFFSIIAIVLLVTTGCYIDYSDGSKDSSGNQIVHTVGNKVYHGEYVEQAKYDKKDEVFAAYVTVYVNEGIIKKVELDEKSNVVSNRKEWKGQPKGYTAFEKKLVKSFEGKKVATVLNYDHSTAKKNEKLDLIAGATDTNNRILKAVQNALSKI